MMCLASAAVPPVAEQPYSSSKHEQTASQTQTARYTRSIYICAL